MSPITTPLRLTGIAVACLIAASAYAVPTTFTQQGRLLNTVGGAYNGTQSATFSLYDVATGGLALWTETHSLTTADGYYSVTLGTSQALDSAVFQGKTLYLGVTVGGQEMSPRTTVVSVPYALRSGGVTTVATTPGAGTCTATTTGAMHFNTTLGAVQVCNGTDWTTLGGGTPTSCAAVLAATPSAPSGTYTIDPDGPSGLGPVSAYCDMSTEGGGWSLCLSVQTTSLHGTDDFPNGQYWRDATFSDTAAGSWTPWDGGPVLPNLGDASGSYGCARHGAVPQEILFEGVYTDGTTKAIRAPLPSNWNTTGEWSSAATRVGRLGTWSNAGTDYVCFTQASLISSTATTCADRYTPNNGGTTFVLGAIGDTFENAAGGCTAADRIGTCGLFLADNQTTWTGENDEIGDHGTYGGWGWAAGSGAPPQRVNVYVR